MLERISTHVVFMLCDVSLKAAVMGALAGLVVRTFRRMSVHAQHRVWTVVLLSFLLLPLLAQAGPTWSLPFAIWPSAMSAVERDAVESQSASADFGATAGNGPIKAFTGRKSNIRQHDLLDGLSSARRTGDVRRDGLPIGTASFELDGREPGASRGVTRRVRWSPRRSSWVVLASMVWLAGVGVMLLRLLIAVFRALRIQRAALLVKDRFFPAGLTIRESAQIESPVVVGWWRPCILLPGSWREWIEAKLAAVISHEHSHLRRRDTQLSLLAELATLLYWFHPVSWWTKRQLSRLAELACDEAAAIEIGDRLVYARYLVEIAAANRRKTGLQSGTAMARSSDVGPRVRVLLDLTRPLALRVSWPALATILLVGIPVVILLAAFRPTRAHTDEQRTEAPSASQPKDAAVPPEQTKPDGEPKKVTPAGADRQSTTTEGPILMMRGTAFLPDGSVAKNAVLALSPGADWSDIVSATIADGQFEIRTTGTKFDPMSPTAILIRTPDSNFQALLIMNSRTLRSECAAPKGVALAQAKVIRVKVTDDKRAVSDCHVQLDAGCFKYLGQTRSDGVAELKIAHDEIVSFICAWSDDHRIGGLFTGRRATKDEYDTDFPIEISHGERVQVRVADALHQPVANVPVLLQATMGARNEMFVGENPTSRQTTSETGEAVFKWVPNWPRARITVRVAENSPWLEMRDREREQPPEGIRQLEVVPSFRSHTNERVGVNGQLKGRLTNVSGLLMEFLSDQGEDESKWDAFFARCDANGRFSARALPGRRYQVFVNDRDLVSNAWDGVIVSSGNGAIRSPELTLTKGLPVEVRATQGPDDKPMQNALIYFEPAHKRLSGLGFWDRTDEHGRCAVAVPAGELHVRIDLGDWNQEKTIQVVEGKAAEIQFRRKYADKQTIIGRLVLPAGVAADLSNTTVAIAGMDGESQDSTNVKSDEEGRFRAGISAGRVSILATSPGEDFFGCGIFDVRERGIEIPMHPTIRYEGSVLGSRGEPLAGITLRITARLVDRGREYPPGTPDFSKQYAELFENRTAVTDTNGHFVMPKTPQRMELSILLTQPGETERAIAAPRYFEPGEARPPETIRLGSGGDLSSRVIKPLELEMSETLSNCRLAGVHALVIVRGAGDASLSFIKAHLSDAVETDEQSPEENDDFYSYLPLYISGPRAAEAPDRRAYLTAHKWPLPETNAIFVAAIDGDGKELGRLRVNLENDQAAAAKDAAAFIKAHLPPQRNAKADYEAALAEAKRSRRRVWVRAGQTRCEPCFTFSRWIDSQRELLAKDYVLFKFDDARDLHGQELSAALKFTGQGVPCHAILDSDGKELVNSIGPVGNIGDPAGSFEGIQHLRKMLKSTARKLSGDDIEALIRSLPRE